MAEAFIAFHLSEESEKIISDVLKGEKNMTEQDLFQDIMVIFCTTWQLPVVQQARIILRKKKKEKNFTFKWQEAQDFSPLQRRLIGKAPVFLIQNILRKENMVDNSDRFFDSAVKNYERLRKKVNEQGYTALLVYPDGEEEVIASP